MVNEVSLAPDQRGPLSHRLARAFGVLKKADFRMRAAALARSRMPALNAVECSTLSRGLAKPPSTRSMLLKSRLAHAEDALAGLPGQKKPGSAEMALSAAMDITSETPAIIEFGHFRVVPRRRELLADGRPIHLGGRTFDVLMALIEGQGAVVAKDTLMERVWPNRIVEENSLHFQISALRDALGAERDLIRSISGRGYQFTGEIRTVAASPHTQTVTRTAVPVPDAPRPLTNLPEPVSELIGRDLEFEEI